MKKIILVCLSLFMLLGCAVRYSVKKGYDFTKVKRIAVCEFSGTSVLANSGDIVADEFVLQMIEKGYNVIERSKVNLLIRERNLDSTDYGRLGKLLGVDAILTGSVTKYAEDASRMIYYTDSSGVLRSEATISRAVVGVSARLIDVNTGEVVWTARNDDEAFDIQNAVSFVVAGLLDSFKAIKLQ